MMHFLGNLTTKPNNDSAAQNNSSLLNTSNTSVVLNTSKVTTEINSNNLNSGFLYKPLVNLPSVGFGAALGLDTSISSSNRYCLPSTGRTRFVKKL